MVAQLIPARLIRAFGGRVTWMKSFKVEIAEPIYVQAARPGGNESATAQAFPVHLSGMPSDALKHFVVCASSPLNQGQRDSVAARLRLGGGSVACDFIIHDTEGEATVVTDTPEDEVSAFEVAAAVAVVKASCGWDESKLIIVWVNNNKVPVVAQFDGKEWIASCSTVG
jgi:hypothetical protein